jgi:virginiamycin A acetyltransferase
MLNGPNPAALHPMEQHQNLVFLKNKITNPNIIVGDYTYYADFTDATISNETYFIILISLAID